MSFHGQVLRDRNSERCSSVLRAAFRAGLSVSFLSVLAVGSLYAQAEKATLSGTVTDSSGAVIVGRQGPSEKRQHRHHIFRRY